MRSRPRTCPKGGPASAILAFAVALALPSGGAATEPLPPLDYGCTVAPHDGQWRGREQASAWLPGFYPADEWPARTVSLTFDDGPMQGRTAQILDLLAEHGYEATFFVVGRQISARTYPLLQRMVAEGHVVANHTWRHDIRMYLDRGQDFTTAYIAAEYGLNQAMVDIAILATSPEDFDALQDELLAPWGTSISIAELTEAWPEISDRHAALLARRNPGTRGSPYPMLYSRAPGGSPYFGSWSQQSREYFAGAVLASGRLNVMWDGSSGDSNSSIDPTLRTSISYLTGNMISAARNGGILLIHDRIPQRALEIAFDAFDDDGVTVRSLDELSTEQFSCAPTLLSAVLGVASADVLLAARGPASMRPDAVLVAEVEQVHAELDAARAELDAARGALDLAHADADALSRLVAEREREVADAREVVETRRAELADARAAADALQRELDTALRDDRTAALELEIEALARALDAAERERDAAAARERDAVAAASNQVAGSSPDAELVAARAESARLRAALESVRAELTATQSSGAATETETLAALRAERDAALSQRDHARASLALLTEELADARRDAEQQRLTAGASEAATLARIADLEADAARVDELSRALTEAEDALAARDVALQTLRDDFEAVDAERDALDAAIRIGGGPLIDADGYALAPPISAEPGDAPALCRATGTGRGQARWVPCPR